mmetsp:Transcript_66187/g.209240  ORF Transcript_66187/g.209240 Transcript_66187/m.209240 type:complete len:339 (+) Transcript_66187:104-1120(+)
MLRRLSHWACFLWLPAGCRARLQQAPPATDELPHIELSLVPPARLAPDISAAVGDLDAARDKQQMALVAEFQQAARRALKTARVRIGAIAGDAARALSDPSVARTLAARAAAERPRNKDQHVAPARASFLGAYALEGMAPDTLKLRVHVYQAAQASPAALIDDIHNIEIARRGAEDARAHKAMKVMDVIVGRVVDELSACVGEHVGSLLARPRPPGTDGYRGSAGHFAHGGFVGRAGDTVHFHGGGGAFLQERTRRDQVRDNAPFGVSVAAGDVPFPTIKSLAEDMEKRRGLSERLVAAEFLRVQSNVMQAVNAMAAEALQGAVQRVLAQHMSKERPI